MAKAIIRPGLLDRLKKYSGIQDDEAFARTIGISRATLNRVRSGQDEPSTKVIVGIASAFGLGLGEVATYVSDDDAAAKAA